MFQDRKTLGQEVVEVIKQAIRTGEFAQGERIVESKLARDLGLSLTPVREAVRELVGEGILTVTPNRGPSVRILGPVDTTVASTLAEQLLAVLREALSNIARHAKADEAEVEIAVSPDEVVLTVTDNGAGLPVERSESGLRNARRRAASHGGTLELEPGLPSGTVFRWRVPVS